MKKYQGHLYETVADWHPVVIQAPTEFYDTIVQLPVWLREHCPNGEDDYDAWCHPDDDLTTAHRSVYFFRDKKVAVLFALRWS